jgi:hypothetical protein
MKNSQHEPQDIISGAVATASHFQLYLSLLVKHSKSQNCYENNSHNLPNKQKLLLKS